MNTDINYYEKVAATVFGCLKSGELRLMVLPGVGHINGGAPIDVSIEIVPFELRMPNTRLWLKFHHEAGQLELLQVWKREPGEWGDV